MAGYILTNERLQIPFISPAQFTLNADFSTAQAVTPGQGQSVRISGVQIGLISGVSLKNGQGVVKMSIDKKYEGLIRTNWTALLRPRTGLDDMFVELSPGVGNAPAAKSGFTIPVSNTMPVVNLDEILSSLDQDSREYLDLLVNGAGQGLQKNGGDELAQVMERFEPTHRDLARVNGRSPSAARTSASSSTRSSASTSRSRPSSRRSSSSIDSSEKVFAAFASENQNVSRAVADLPSTLNQTTATLAKVQAFAQQLGPAATNLLPAASALKGANQALTALAVPGAPIVQNQIRPFVVAARPVVRNLRPAAVNLAAATPNLTQGVHGAQPLREHGRLQPGQHRARLPVVAGLARPQRPHAVLGAGRQRRLPPAVPPGQLRDASPSSPTPRR